MNKGKMMKNTKNEKLAAYNTMQELRKMEYGEALRRMELLQKNQA